jgi:hypothetical protein
MHGRQILPIRRIVSIVPIVPFGEMNITLMPLGKTRHVEHLNNVCRRGQCRRVLASSLLVISSAMVCFGDQPPTAPTRSEDDKIELLIRYIESMDDARFIRNGTEYSSERAARHLRKKWGQVKTRIHTAEQFIDDIASRSSVSDKPYLIRRADGSTVTSRDALQKKLEEIETTGSDSSTQQTP